MEPLRGESSKRADLPRKEAEFFRRVSTIVGPFVVDLRRGLSWLKGSVLFPLVVGELSGERDGKDTNDLAESGIGVTKDCFREVDRRGTDLREELDTCELFRSRFPFALLCIVNEVNTSVSTCAPISVEILKS